MYTFDINFNFMSDSLVIIPTYNEKENIENIIRAVFGLSKPFDILVIDDGSPDGTAAIVHRLAETEFSDRLDRKSTRLNSSHVKISYAVFCLKKKNKTNTTE